jgi:tetratricopeptide (TPR) repeat protein
LRLGTELLSAYGANPGRNRRDAIDSVHGLADTYVSLGRHAEAILLLEEWLPRLVTAKDRPEAPNDLWKLTVNERYTAAIRQLGAPKLRDDLVAVCKAKDGPDHPSAALLASLQALARRCSNLLKHSEAVRLDEEVLAMHRAKFAPDDSATYQAMEHLAATYRLARRNAEAAKLHAEMVELLEDRLARQVARLGPDHLDLLPVKLKLAVDYNHAGRYADALKLHQNVLELRRSKLGPDHPDTLTSMRTVALFLVQLNRGAEALPLIDECAKHADRKDVEPTMIPLMGLRLQHFERVRDVAGCRETAELWEKLNRTDADSLYMAARMHAVTASVIRRAGPKSGLQAEDAVAEADRAMASLKRAVAAGLKDAARLKVGKDFDVLRDRAEFTKLVAEVEKKASFPVAPRPAQKELEKARGPSENSGDK